LHPCPGFARPVSTPTPGTQKGFYFFSEITWPAEKSATKTHDAWHGNHASQALWVCGWLTGVFSEWWLWGGSCLHPPEVSKAADPGNAQKACHQRTQKYLGLLEI
jgi:hypothetical protein